MEVVVSVLPALAYEISWDNKVVDVDHKYPIIKSANPYGEDTIAASTTELGDMCTPACDEHTEGLFEYEYWSSGIGANYNAAMDDYRVVHPDGTPLFGCGAFGCRAFYLSLYKHKTCLPIRDVCYQFNIGSSKRLHHTIGKSSYAIHYDGKLVDKKDTWLFESIKFGHNCQPTCNPVTESTVEYFLHQVSSDSSSDECDPEQGCGLHWELDHELSQNANNREDIMSSRVTAASKTIDFTSNESDYILVHETICVPKNKCALFHIASKNTENFLHFAPRYFLTMDGVTYRNTKWWSRDNEELDQFTPMGPCAASQ